MNIAARIGLAILASLAIATPASAQPTTQDSPDAIAELQNRQGNVVGYAYLTNVEDGVQIQVRMTGLETTMTDEGWSEHGFHIHETGTCNPPDFSSAGGHFNPTGVGHGLLDTDGAHAGDLPNLLISPDGSASYQTTTDLVTLDSGERGLFDADGSALVLHSEPDDYLTDPAGDSGDRVACGVITRSQ